jgi:hypothetical protein
VPWTPITRHGEVTPDILLVLPITETTSSSTNLAEILSEAGSGTIAHKNKKRITAGTYSTHFLFLSPQIMNSSGMVPTKTSVVQFATVSLQEKAFAIKNVVDSTEKASAKYLLT